MNNIFSHTTNIILLEDKLKTNYNSINELFLLYKDFMKFIRLLKIVELEKWELLKLKYKELKLNIKSNKQLYNTILKNYDEIIYKYIEKNAIEINNNKINKLKETLDTNNFHMYNLQKEHKFISNKFIQLKKNNNIYKTNKINFEIQSLLNEHYRKNININKINNNYKVIKNKIKQIIRLIL
jgi:hypothetical protein